MAGKRKFGQPKEPTDRVSENLKAAAQRRLGSTSSVGSTKMGPWKGGLNKLAGRTSGIGFSGAAASLAEKNSGQRAAASKAASVAQFGAPGLKTAPGLVKKPGGMPPGQFKKK